LMYTCHEAGRRRCLGALAQSGTMRGPERELLAAVLSARPPSEVASIGVGTDLSWGSLDEQQQAAHVAISEEVDAHVAAWSERAERRMTTYREALYRLDLSRGDATDYGLTYYTAFGPQPPLGQMLALTDLLPRIGAIFGAKARADSHLERGVREPISLSRFLVLRATPHHAMAKGGAATGAPAGAVAGGAVAGGVVAGGTMGSGKAWPQGAGSSSLLPSTLAELSSLLQSTVAHAATSWRVHLFARAVGLAPPLAEGPPATIGATDRPACAVIRAVYGGPEAIGALFGRHSIIMLTREAADGARVATLPTSPGTAASSASPFISWSSVDDVIEASELPPHLAQAALEAASSQKEPVLLKGLDADAAFGLREEALLAVVCHGWEALRGQRMTMLRDCFAAADADEDGALTVPEFWACLQAVLRSMSAAGGEAAATAEPWLDRGAAEQLYNQVLVESELLTPLVERGLVSCDGWVGVMMRRHLYPPTSTERVNPAS